MTLFSFTDCCAMLAVDPKTLRLWLQQSEISLHVHPTDARLKCVSTEDVWQLASLHARPIQPTATASPVRVEAAHEETVVAASILHEADLIAKVAHLETEVVAMQAQMTQLALALLQERDCRDAPGAAVSCQSKEVSAHPWEWHPTEKRARVPLIPLIEYGADGAYVLISPEEGELPIVADSLEWFAWLASLSSFRFVGTSGRFGARRGYNRRPNRCWYAQRTFHHKNYSKYLGVSEHITTARLEQVAAELQSYADLR